MHRSLPLSLLPLLLASACTVGPDYHAPETRAAPAWLEAGAPGQVDLQWWDRFGDPQLSSLVQRAVASSPDLKEAEGRLAEARANREAIAGGRLPSVTAKGSATENVLSKNGQLPIGNIPGFQREFPLYDLGFDASWEIDLWGRRTRQMQGATARLESATYAKRDVMLTLIAEVVRSYMDLRAAQADGATAEAQATSNAELARLTRLRFDAGEASRLELDRADAAAKASAAAVPNARAQASAAAYRIATLVGVPPEQVVPELQAPAPLPASPDAILVGLRSELLERRPDVRRAERDLAAATADIGVATADLFPRFSLLGSLGQQARTPGDLFSGDSFRLQVGPSFSWPIFQGGTIRAQIRAADARADQAAARYEKAVIGALSDSEAAINRFLNARAAAEDAAASLAREQNAFGLAQQRADRGEDDRLTLERARQSLLSAQQRDQQARAAKAQAATALYKALGGGWS
ncbi:efflux transporter outer membrane subunit [Sphingomonas sp. HITSZ_GF]|uniref:efflux transporter outer membrane subunit n=1 Tax=Sphingomonas sp. HITSZ_GF TaxID=3037247 RepID=UPI00240D11B7|nr:efflux transporter outer membrane subunit [Sphingomonas sp. HITSZ_GF]MDG2533494.1 efflux transporter outer membrane subunit [Sphingomonas sp. HITSZ_GF]